METVPLKCRQCGALMRYAVGTSVIKCDYCGAEYLLKREPLEEDPIKNINYMNQGALFRAYVPQGWTYRVFDCSNDFSRHAPSTKGLRLDSPSGAQIMFFPWAYYKDLGPERGGFNLGVRRNYFFDPAALLRYRQRPSLEVYAAERLAEQARGATDIHVERVCDFDETLLKQANAFVKQVADTLGGTFAGFFGKYRCELTLEGARLKGFFASINAYRTAQQSAPAQSRGGGGLLGNLMNGLGSLAGALGTMNAPDWARCYDIMLFVQNEDPEVYNKLFNDFASSIQYGDLYYALCDDELRRTEQVQIQGAMDRQRIAFEGAQRVRQIHQQTSDIINRGYEQRSRAMSSARGLWTTSPASAARP